MASNIDLNQVNEPTNTIIGTNGRDVIVGQNGNDVYELKGGDDSVKDYCGDDTYLYNLGDGFDEITDNNGFDKVVFGQGITLDNLEFTTVCDSSLSIKIKGTEDGMLLVNWLLPKYQIENIVLSDGQLLTPDDVLRHITNPHTEGNDLLFGNDSPNTIHGLGGNDIIFGFGGNDELYGDQGADILYGGDGDDTLISSTAIPGGTDDGTLIGGLGNDSLFGSLGNTTYVYTRGDGNDYILDFGLGGPNDIDTLRFFPVTAGDLIFTPELTSLKIGLKNSYDEIFVEDWGDYESHHNIERMEFTINGTSLNSEEIDSLIKGKAVVGTDGDDNLEGSFKDDTITGGKGNDTIFDIQGNDIYNFNRGDGQDTISDSGILSTNYYANPSTQDVMKFGADITKDSLIYTKDGSGLIVTFNNSTDKITIKNWYDPQVANAKIETFIFADGSSITSGEIDNIVNNNTPTNGDDVLYDDNNANSIDGLAGNDIIYGLGGNDTLIGNLGNDTIGGGDGDDLIYGDAFYDSISLNGDDYLIGQLGNDTLFGGTGDDIYQFDLGDGQDVIYDYIDGIGGAGGNNDSIKFKGIFPDDIMATTSDNDMVISIKNTNDKITMKDWAPSEFGDNKIETFQFSDGTILTDTDIENMVQKTFVGTDGNDVIDSNWFDNTIQGKKGNDTIYGGEGSDTYIFNQGDGQDIIDDVARSGVDTIKFGPGITLDQLDLSKEGVSNLDLEITIKNTNDKITVSSQFDNLPESYAAGVEVLEFDDGTKIDMLSIAVGTDNADTIIGNEKNNVIYGKGGNDYLVGNSGNDFLSGGDDDDIIYGDDVNGHETYNDTIEGNTGNDTLYGGDGNDTYIFNKGDGQDVIYDADDYDFPSNDTLKFGDGITTNDLTFIRHDNSLLIKFNNSTDQIIVKNHFYSPEFNETTIEKFEFVDGSILSSQDIENLVVNIIKGTNGNDLLVGSDIADYIYGYAGNDTLIGAKGNDLIYDSSGNDTYVFNKGDGQDFIQDQDGTDTLKFGIGINKDDLEFIAQEPLDLVINIKNSSNKITINNWDYGWKIENLLFDNGDTLSSSDVNSLVKGITVIGTEGNDNLSGAWSNDTIYGLAGNDYLDGGVDTSHGYPEEGGSDYLDGGAGNDTIMGYEGNNTLIGGAGDDYVSGASGNDTYIFNRGDGNDHISDSDPDTPEGGGSFNDILKFGPSITQNDVEFTRQGEDIKVNIKNSNDSIVINSWYLSEDYGYNNFQIERFEFADGSVLTNTDVDNIINDPSITETVVGTDGNDKFSGCNGDDIYDLKKGYDIVKDYLGNDTYLFNKGDGFDSITDNNGSDEIKFGQGLTKNDLSVMKDGNSLVLGINGNDDGMQIVNWFSQPKYQIEKIGLSTGEFVTNDDINHIIQGMAAYSVKDNFQITNINEVQRSPELMTMISSSWHN
ncbi:MAG: calcium-binding protein [bacterium]